MKVYNLRCAHDHCFEGWFASDADYVAQRERALVTCPLCEDADVQRMPSAPRLNLGAVPPVEPAPPSSVASATTPAPQTVVQAPAHLQAAWFTAVQQLMAKTEDVGERFPEEARRIHYGETAQRPIRGQASLEESSALREEGIEVMAVPIPAALKRPMQ